MAGNKKVRSGAKEKETRDGSQYGPTKRNKCNKKEKIKEGLRKGL
jgi:hypothetical protein